MNLFAQAIWELLSRPGGHRGVSPAAPSNPIPTYGRLCQGCSSLGFWNTLQAEVSKLSIAFLEVTKSPVFTVKLSNSKPIT